MKNLSMNPNSPTTGAFPGARFRLATCLAGALMVAGVQAETVFDDFNLDEGHFNVQPTYSGSTAGTATSSTADRVTTNSPVEGLGQQRLVFNAITNGNNMRIRHLSGVASPANNTPFTTSAGEDGWIGVYLKTAPDTDTNWTVQIWIEGPSNNGGIQKSIITDGEWHLYEWNLDDDTGGPDGWGDIPGILGGNAIVSDGSHTIDSIIFRNTNGPVSSTLFMDFVAKSDSGSISNLLSDPCLATPKVLVNGPLSVNNSTVRVVGVLSNATEVTVYQSSGGGGALVPIGSLTSNLVAGANDVPVSGLVKSAAVLATQTVDGQESCIPALENTDDELYVGGGANPRIRVALSIRETSGTGPVGDPGITDIPKLHFLGASFRTNSAPGDGIVINPSTSWQTVSIDAGLESTLDAPTNVTVAVNDSGDYAPNDTVEIQVYAFTFDFVNFEDVYSLVGAASPVVSSNDTFGVQWTWDAVSGVDGYRLLRNLNSAGFTEYVDVLGSATYFDVNSPVDWLPGSTVTPKAVVQTAPSVQWFGTGTGNTNNLGTPWGILDGIAITIDDLTDTGPHDFYIDNLQNGATVFQDFEGFVAGTQEAGFRAPSYSGSSVGLLSAPDQSIVSNGAADTGTKSVRVQFQWKGTNATEWLRLTTFTALGTPYPMVNLADPISFRILLLPVGSSPVAPPAPDLSIELINGEAVLDWVGTHNLQESTNVAGPYVNTTDGGNVTQGPYTNAPTEDVLFFRLAN